MAQEQSERTAGSAPPYLIIGPRVALGSLRRDLIPLYTRWANDFAVTRTMGSSTPVSIERLTATLAQIEAGESSVDFTIYDRATGTPIGNTAWIGIDWRAGTAEYILYIGEPAYRGRGLGGEVTQLMLAHAFDTLGLHNVMLRVYTFNLAGQRVYLRAGFREFGRRREAKALRDQFWDVIYMECLANEWERPAAISSDGSPALRAPDDDRRCS